MPTLHWNTRKADIRAAARAPFHTLSAVNKLGHGDNKTQNLLVQGDNLLALKALVPHYAGAVKCIFIDPPYNTRKDFPHYQDNLEHTQWLEMMWPRLELLHELLAENGSIWVIIDDDEAHYLKVLMDEIFGRKNFVANVVWQKKHTRANDARLFSDNHDHIIVHAKNKSKWSMNLLPRSEERNLRNLDNDPRGPWASQPIQAKSPSPNYIYEIQNPAGMKFWPPQGRSWQFSKEKFCEMVLDNRIWFGRHGRNVPRIKAFVSEMQEGMTALTIWPHEEVGHNQHAKDEAKKHNPEDVFATPKPERLIMRVLQLATQPGDIVLDSFLGSGTTAAVAHKMERRWIGIEMGEHMETHCIPRLRAVTDGKDSGGITEAAEWKGGGGFRFSRLGPPIFAEDGSVNPEIKFPELAAHIWFSETRTPLSPTRKSTPFLGAHKGAGYALLYNGILKDKRVNGGNILTRRTLAECREAATAGGWSAGGSLIIYGNGNRLSAKAMREAGAEFRQIPYEVKKR